MSQQQPQPSYNSLVLQWLENFFMGKVTSTPAQVRFTAAEIAAHYGDPVEEVSKWLQIYRKLQGRGITEYWIGTTGRGAGTQWVILMFPGMYPGQVQTANELLLAHNVVSYLRETLDPTLRNVMWEFVPTMRSQPRRLRARSIITMNINVLTGFKTVLLNIDHDLQHPLPRYLRPVAGQVRGLVGMKVNDVDNAIVALQAL